MRKLLATFILLVCIKDNFSFSQTNLALNKRTNASTESTGYGSANSVDGNLSTYWAPADGTFPQWITVDLARISTLTMVKNTFFNNATWYYKIEASNTNSAEDFHLLADKTGTGTAGASITETVTGNYRYVRLTITGCSLSGAWAASKELEVQGSILSQSTGVVPSIQAVIYPESQHVKAVDTFWGTTVNDPYRWLEDTGAATRNWVSAQNKTTDLYFSKVPFFKSVKKRMTELWNYPKQSDGFVQNGYTFFYKNEGLLNQSKLYRQQPGKDAEVFLDPNQWAPDGSTSLSSIHFSKDGRLVACQISEAGTDWHKLVVLKTDDKGIVGDTLYNIRFSGLVWRGNEGFYYSTYPNTNLAFPIAPENCRLYFHRLGTAQSADSLIFSDNATPGNFISISTTSDYRYLIISNANGLHSNNQLYLLDMSQPLKPLVPMVEKFDGEHIFLFNEGSKLFILSSLNAPNNRLMSVDVSSPAVVNWKEVLAERGNILTGVSNGGGKLFGIYLKDVASEVIQYNKDGNYERIISLPGEGTASGFAGADTATSLYYTFTSYTLPVTTYKYDIRSGQSELFKKADSIPGFDASHYESKRIFYNSKDGIKVPMYITYKKGLKRDGKNPTVLYGYGGFKASLSPVFNLPNVALLEKGFICAVANLRGGAEYGEAWHTAGTKMQKQNVFDDFIAAAEYLIDSNYTSPAHLALHGISNGGLLAGAVLTQRPELFKVALVDVGVLDVIRFHRYGLGMITRQEYGIPQDSREMFEYLLRYSPYQALKKGKKYPATLVITADHDDSVTPYWSYKFAARLQEYQSTSDPVLLRTEINVGHGYGKSTSITISEQSEQWAFLFYNMAVPWEPPPTN